jgi:hypothetical protein
VPYSICYGVPPSKIVKIRIYRTVILPVVLYGCRTWSLTIRAEQRPRVFGNRLLRTVFPPKSAGVTGGWRKLHNDELRDLYSSPGVIRIIKSKRMRWAGHVARVRVLVGKPEGKRPQRRPRRRWVDNIKMDLVEIGGVVWTGFFWLRIGTSGQLL